MSAELERRVLIAGVLAGGAALTASSSSAQQRPQGSATMARELYELRTYRLVRGPMMARLDAYLKDAFIPAARRAGCGPIGVFTLSVGVGSPSLFVLVPHPSLHSFFALPGALAADPAYVRAAEPFLSATPQDPPYAALEVRLMHAFPHFPRVEPPAATPGRVFELRTYRSHGERAGARKIEMFDTGGEIPIFRRTGLDPVFFAQDLTGDHLPSLTYMLTFPDMATREKNWQAFRTDPQWRVLAAMPGLTDPEITTAIEDQLLAPTPYSQI